MITANLLTEYRTRIRGELKTQFKLKNDMAAARLVKIVINMGVGEATQNPKELDAAVEQLARIAGQRPSVRRSKKSISNFKIRKGQAIGCMVTLRGPRMYEFFERLVRFALPRIRDFRGVPTDSFDGRGNYTFGVTEQIIFPEIEYDKIDKVRGMDITIVTSAGADEPARALLIALGFPFARKT
ncbi:MAG: 50S ribosomal protein L5 [Candidatus Coatesbacteria bacterium]